MFAVAKLAARLDQLVDCFAHRPDGAPQTSQLRIDVLRHDLADDDPGLVQHHRSNRQTGI